MTRQNSRKIHLDWVDGLKAFAILGILLNHLVEAYGAGPWFSNPSYNWPDIETRMDNILPAGDNPIIILVKFLGWLGDMGPGVFILLSGFTLALSQSKRGYSTFKFYKKRLLRIYPLYITIHIIILGFLLFSNQIEYFDKQRTFLSLLGLRFHDALFFYLNPSWWFIWIILQLYLFFPLLYRFLAKRQSLFLLVTLFITLASRLAGLMDVTYSNSLYFWMTGLFFGTRLFEFTIGMYLGYLLYRQDEKLLNLLNNEKKILLYSILIYALGFGLSLTYAGSLFSNILISIGLSGIFYGIYRMIQSKRIKGLIGQVGLLAFPVFLIHQPFMEYISNAFSPGTSLFLNILFMILCFPLGYLINKTVEHATYFFSDKADQIGYYGDLKPTRLSLSFLIMMVLLLNITHGMLDISKSLNISLLTATTFVLAAYYLFETRLFSRPGITFTLVLVMLIGSFLFILPFQWLPVLSVLSIPGLIIAMISSRLSKKSWFNIIYTFSVILVFVLAENQIRAKMPVETGGKWGEYPALQPDERTVYSLIPNKTTRLQYNNYDYVLQTNSMGFHSPEIDLEREKDTHTIRIFIVGDAFSMPEGVDYNHMYSRLLEHHLTQRYPGKTFQVINGGITGYGPNEMLLQLKAFVDTIKPDWIINQIFINEFAEINIDPGERIKNIGFEHDIREYELFGYSQLSVHIGNTVRNLANIPDSSYNYSMSLMKFYEKNSGFYHDTIVSKMEDYLENIKKISRKNDSRLLVMYVPGQIEVSKPQHIDYYPHHIDIRDTSQYDLDKPNQIIQQLCRNNDIALFDTEQILINHPVQPVYYPGSWHWNREGHKVIAMELAKQIKP
jgi:peptidoglycan/LPS O-acetylase OafA/YrhL/lysophospholipase L1-like esterase